MSRAASDTPSPVQGGELAFTAIELLKAKIAEEPVPVLRGKPIPPVGVPGSDVQRGSAKEFTGAQVAHP